MGESPTKDQSEPLDWPRPFMYGVWCPKSAAGWHPKPANWRGRLSRTGDVRCRWPPATGAGQEPRSVNSRTVRNFLRKASWHSYGESANNSGVTANMAGARLEHMRT